MGPTSALVSLAAGVFLNGQELLNGTSSWSALHDAILQPDKVGFWATPGVCYSNYSWVRDASQNLLHSVCHAPAASSSSAVGYDAFGGGKCAVSCYYSDLEAARLNVTQCYSQLDKVTDGDASYTAMTLEFLADASKAYFVAPLDPPRPVSWLAVRAKWSEGADATVVMRTVGGVDVVVPIHQNVSDDHVAEGIPVSSYFQQAVGEGAMGTHSAFVDQVLVLFNRTTCDFTSCAAQIHEIAAFSNDCADELVLDFHSLVNVSHIEFEMYTSNVRRLDVAWSPDGVTFSHSRDIEFNASVWNIDRVLQADFFLQPSGGAPSTTPGPEVTAHSDGASVGLQPLIARFVRIRSVNTFKSTFRKLRVFGQPFEPSDTRLQCAESQWCSGHGLCQEAGVCACDDAFEGTNCSHVRPGTCASMECCVALLRSDDRCTSDLPRRCLVDCWDSGASCNNATGHCECTPSTAMRGGYAGRDCGVREPRQRVDFSAEMLDFDFEQGSSVPGGASLLVNGRDPSTLTLVDAGVNYWQSENTCWDDMWRHRLNLDTHNLLLGACAAGFCTASCECAQASLENPEAVATYACSEPLSPATNGDSNDGTFIRYNSGYRQAWFEAVLPRSAKASAVYISGHFPAPTRVVVVDAMTGIHHVVPNPIVTNDTEWDLGRSHFIVDLESFALASASALVGAIRLEADSTGANNGYCYAGTGECLTFTLKEIAVLPVNYTCAEDIVIELDAVYNLSAVRVNMYKDYLTSVRVLTALELGGLGLNADASLASLEPSARGGETNEEPGVVDGWVVHHREQFDASRWDLDFVAEFWPVRRLARFIRILLPYDGLKIAIRQISLYGLATDGQLGKCPNNCSGIVGACASTGRCSCPAGLEGADCGLRQCHSVPEGRACGLNGTCNGLTGLCRCHAGFGGPFCNVSVLCPGTGGPSGACHGRGACVAGHCQCVEGSSGSDCRYLEFSPEDLMPWYNASSAESGINRQAAIRALGLGGFPRSPGGPPSGANISQLSSLEDINCAKQNSRLPFACRASADCVGALGHCDAMHEQAFTPTPPPLSPVPFASESYTSTGRASRAPHLAESVNVTSGESTAFAINDDEAPADHQWCSTFSQCRASGGCWENVTVDFGSIVPIGAVKLRHYVSGYRDIVGEARLQWATEDLLWNEVPFENDPDAASVALSLDPPYFGSELEVSPVVHAQFLRLAQRRHENSTGKVCVTFLWAWDEDGPFGLWENFTVHPRASSGAIRSDGKSQHFSLQSMLGVNGIWGWGGGFSNSQGGFVDGRPTVAWGPHRFSKFATHGRNYHNWNWDAPSPTDRQDFSIMGCGAGTRSFWWNDWHAEYRGWRSAGMEVQASIQFGNSFEPSVAAWGGDLDAARTAAFEYGFSFARHMGPTHGSGDVSVVEVGNEPFDYPVDLYRAILLGMASGIKAADAAVRVIPAFVHFYDLVNILDRNISNVSSYIDGLNLHAYSWRYDAPGRSGVWPESRVSVFSEVLRLFSFRDANFPSLPIFLTEFGWDSDGGGDTCEMPECVSEVAQARYIVRALLMMAGINNIPRASVFFYANTDSSSSGVPAGFNVFSRSGLVASSASGFRRKTSLRALEGLVATAGRLVFHESLQQTDLAWANLFSDDSFATCYPGSPGWTTAHNVGSHIVVWRPVSGDDNSTKPALIRVTRSQLFPATTTDVITGCSYNGSNISLSSLSSRSPLPAAAWLLGNDEVHLDPSLLPTLVDCNRSLGDNTSTEDVFCFQFPAVGSAPLALRLAFVPVQLAAAASNQVHVADDCFPPCVDGQGICLLGACMCHHGFVGENCGRKSCPSDCYDHGTCEDHTSGTCRCEAWISEDAHVHDKDIASLPAADLLLSSADGFVFWDPATNCATSVCPLNCSGHGVCAVPPHRGGISQCLCDDGFGGVHCQLSGCPAGCRGHGTCTQQTNTSTISYSADGNAFCDCDSVFANDLNAPDCSWTANIVSRASVGPPNGHVCVGASKTSRLPCASAETLVGGHDSARECVMALGNCSAVVQNWKERDEWNLTGLAPQPLELVLQEASSAPQHAWKATDGSTVSAWQGESCVNRTQASGFPGWDCVEFLHWSILSVGSDRSNTSAVPPVVVGAVQVMVYEYATYEYAANVLTTLVQIQEGTIPAGESSWTTLHLADGGLRGSIDLDISPPREIVAIRIVHVLKAPLLPGATSNVPVHEVLVWDEHGPYGPRVGAPAGSLKGTGPTLGSMLGVNGIWGFGTDSYSDRSERWGVDERASEFAAAFSHARNYHNWNWDVSDPDDPPAFQFMDSGHDSALAQDWLDWDREYATWRGVGLAVQASVQFTADFFPSETFSDPYAAGYHYGLAFARHFGPTFGTGDVDTLEVGNEPIDYPADVYGEVLLGMSQGAKEGDSALRVLPGFLYPVDKFLAAVNRSHFRWLDGINVHSYSWANGGRADAQQIAAHPESKVSILWQAINWYRGFRDRNLPSLPLYMTEFGWDSSGGGESCTFAKCVSEVSQARFMVRASLILARSGFARASVFFYANTLEEVETFSRSGLTGSSETNFARKTSFDGMEHLAQSLGNLTFLQQVREDHEAWVYIFGPPNIALLQTGTRELSLTFVGWKPLSEAHALDSSLNASSIATNAGEIAAIIYNNSPADDILMIDSVDVEFKSIVSAFDIMSATSIQGAALCAAGAKLCMNVTADPIAVTVAVRMRVSASVTTSRSAPGGATSAEAAVPTPVPTFASATSVAPQDDSTTVFIAFKVRAPTAPDEATIASARTAAISAMGASEEEVAFFDMVVVRHEIATTQAVSASLNNESILRRRSLANFYYTWELRLILVVRADSEVLRTVSAPSVPGTTTASSASSGTQPTFATRLQAAFTQLSVDMGLDMAVEEVDDVVVHGSQSSSNSSSGANHSSVNDATPFWAPPQFSVVPTTSLPRAQTTTDRVAASSGGLTDDDIIVAAAVPAAFVLVVIVVVVAVFLTRQRSAGSVSKVAPSDFPTTKESKTSPAGGSDSVTDM